MNIITLLGSPRKKGNTATMLDLFENLAASYCTAERINLVDVKIHGCRGCNACQKKIHEPGCIQKDDFLIVLNRLLTADIIVYASPLYVWSFPAQMKALLDRQYCLAKWNEETQSVISLLAGKRTALLVTCGGSEKEDADLIKTTFDRAMAFLSCKVVGKYIVSNCTTPGQLGNQANRVAWEMFNQIVKTYGND